MGGYIYDPVFWVLVLMGAVALAPEGVWQQRAQRWTRLLLFWVLVLIGASKIMPVAYGAWALPSSVPPAVQTLTGQADARAYEEVAVGATAVGFSAPSLALIPSPRLILVTVETAQIRYRYDGGTPTSSSGHLADVGDSFWVSGINNINQFKAIRTTAASGVIHATVH